MVLNRQRELQYVKSYLLQYDNSNYVSLLGGLIATYSGRLVRGKEDVKIKVLKENKQREKEMSISVLRD